MTSIISRYFLKTVFMTIFVTLMVIISFNFIAVIVDELADINDKYTFLDATLHAVLKIPSQSFEYLPAIILIGCLIGLGVMANSNELTVIRASGVSTLQVFWHITKPVALFVLLGLLVAQFVAPNSLQFADERKKALRKGTSLSLNERGIWTRQQHDFVRVNRVNADGSIEEVVLFHYDPDDKLKFFVHAERAEYLNYSWKMTKVIRTDLESNQIKQVHLNQFLWPSDLTPNVLKFINLDPSYLSLTELYAYIKYLQSQNMDSASYELVFWDKSLQPLVCLSLLLVGLVFIIGPLRNVSIGYRVFAGILIGFSLRIVQQVMGQLGLVYHWSPLWMVLLPALVVAAIGLLLLQKK